MSKQLESIMKSFPSATAKGEEQTQIKLEQQREWPSPQEYIAEKTERLVAEVPRILKKEIKEYIENNKGFTEKTVILMALKKFGFNVKEEWIMDNRTAKRIKI